MSSFKKLLKHPLLKSSLIYTLCDALNKAVPFLVLPLLSYYLTPGDYGIVANFNILLAVATICVALSVEGVIGVNFYRISKEELGKYIYNAIVLISIASVLVLTLGLVCQDLIYNSFKIPYSYVIWSVVMAFAATMTNINLALWRLEEKPLKFGIYQISQTVVNIGVSLLLVIIYQLGWIGRVDGIIIATLIFGCFSLVLLWKRGYLKVQNDKGVRLAILAFGLPLIPHALSIWLRSGIDRIYITNMYGEEATGLYATGFQFGVLVSFLILAFNNAFVPYLYKSLSETDESILLQNKKRLRKITYFGMIGLTVVSVLFYILSIFILDYFFNQTYSGAAEFILWAIVAQLFQGFYLFFVNYIFFMKKTKPLAMITFSCALLQVFFSYFSVSKFGPIGGAYSTVVVSFLNFVIVAWFSNKVYKMNWLKNNN
ncbi:oligosaccharide flippase family protein [Myroides marinus]|uniref:lipopolysaccharide biosynthesis protein n=1 Tax=Myroides marinus TaxID=703342 RepID=UPI0025758473|nr:oligosaccharide flippase family protein [Myroides marinus]MDM1352175.1 oligosaccharide flippase family protein [Myroides marinus]MDM1359386.1 oligosaccharide flippase family protein [Myroides marinus]MDM1366505.1 oligosaccharide flippase family protein [Myroides marinus]